MQTPLFEKHVWAEIDLEALRYNFREVKARAGALPLCAVVKADSYGHGAVQCARVFAEEGAAWLAVSCLTEAVQLRKAGQTLPILILGHVQPAYAAALTGASQLLADEARVAGTYTGKEPFNFTVAVLFPAAQVSGAAPQVPTGLLTHQVARF